MAKFSIWLTELTRSEGRERVPAFMGRSAEDAASKKVITILFFSIGQAARKILLDNFRAIQIATKTLPELSERCGQAFEVKRKRSLERFRFFSCKQEQNESLQQLWNAHNGLAANCEFEWQIISLVYDIFNSNMHNKAVQERLCTEPKSNPNEALQFAVAFEEGVKRQAFDGNQNWESKLEVKTKPNSMCTNTSGKVCFSCGSSNFTLQHISQCRAAKKMWMKRHRWSFRAMLWEIQVANTRGCTKHDKPKCK